MNSQSRAHGLFSEGPWMNLKITTLNWTGKCIAITFILLAHGIIILITTYHSLIRMRNDGGISPLMASNSYGTRSATMIPSLLLAYLYFTTVASTTATHLQFYPQGTTGFVFFFVIVGSFFRRCWKPSINTYVFLMRSLIATHTVTRITLISRTAWLICKITEQFLPIIYLFLPLVTNTVLRMFVCHLKSCVMPNPPTTATSVTSTTG